MVTPVALVLQFISGVFFVFTDLPGRMQQVAALFPLKWLCQGMRSVFLPDSFAGQEAAGSGSSAGSRWCSAPGASVGLVLCLTTFRWSHEARRLIHRRARPRAPLTPRSGAAPLMGRGRSKYAPRPARANSTAGRVGTSL